MPDHAAQFEEEHCSLTGGSSLFFLCCYFGLVFYLNLAKKIVMELLPKKITIKMKGNNKYGCACASTACLMKLSRLACSSVGRLLPTWSRFCYLAFSGISS